MKFLERCSGGKVQPLYLDGPKDLPDLDLDLDLAEVEVEVEVEIEVEVEVEVEVLLGGAIT